MMFQLFFKFPLCTIRWFHDSARWNRGMISACCAFCSEFSSKKLRPTALIHTYDCLYTILSCVLTVSFWPFFKTNTLPRCWRVAVYDQLLSWAIDLYSFGFGKRAWARLLFGSPEQQLNARCALSIQFVFHDLCAITRATVKSTDLEQYIISGSPPTPRPSSVYFVERRLLCNMFFFTSQLLLLLLSCYNII